MTSSVTRARRATSSPEGKAESCAVCTTQKRLYAMYRRYFYPIMPLGSTTPSIFAAGVLPTSTVRRFAPAGRVNT